MDQKQKKHSLLDLAGLLSDEEAKEIKKHIKEMRQEMEKGIEKRAKRIKDALESMDH